MGLVHEIDYGTPASKSEKMVTLTIDGECNGFLRLGGRRAVVDFVDEGHNETPSLAEV